MDNHQNTSNMNILILLISIFIASLVIASILAFKIINVFGFFVPAGILAYSVTFTSTDIISEVWGKKIANTVVISGFVALVVMAALIQLALIWTPAPFWNAEEEFKTVLGLTGRIIFASISAYLISQLHDVWLFHLLKDRTKGEHLWLRNILSTSLSQFIDSLVFIIIAFWGIMPIIPLIFGQWIIKLFIALLDTPVVYFGTHLINNMDKRTKYNYSSQSLIENDQ